MWWFCAGLFSYMDVPASWFFLRLQLLFFPALHITLLKCLMNGMLCSWKITRLKWLTWLSQTELTGRVAALWQGEWLLFSQKTTVTLKCNIKADISKILYTHLWVFLSLSTCICVCLSVFLEWKATLSSCNCTGNVQFVSLTFFPVSKEIWPGVLACHKKWSRDHIKHEWQGKVIACNTMLEWPVADLEAEVWGWGT